MRISRIALALFLLLFAQSAAAQDQTFTSLGGPWWLTIGGKDKGAVVLQFSAPKGGAFDVEDVDLTEHPSFGYSRAVADFFQIEAGQTLVLDSKRSISGDLELSEPGGPVISVLSIAKGKVNKTFTKLSLKGTIEGVDGPVVVKLKGTRPPSSFPVLTGRTTEGNLKGKAVKSKALELSVQQDDVLGLPAYMFSGAGPVEIDKEEVPDVTVDGRVVLMPNFKAFGLLDDSSDFGDGQATGKLSVKDPNAPVPKLGLNLAAEPKLKLKGQLTEPVEPILLVAPTTYAFPATRLGETSVFTFSVSNVGTGSLSGTATFLAGSSPDFSLSDANSYGPLESGDAPEEIEVTFAPVVAGAKTASLRFSVEAGAGAIVVPLTGTAGVSEIAVDPDPIEFGDVSISGTPEIIVATIHNTGDSTLVGQASLATSLQFSLVGLGPISYSVPPDGTQDISVRFAPTIAGNATTTLTLTGATAGNKTVTVTGTGTSP